MDGWLQPPVSTELSVMVLIMIRLVPMTCSVEWWINAKLKQNTVLAFLFTGVSSQLPELDSWRDGRVELGISILQSAKCWSITVARQDERIYLLICDIYVRREIVNVHTGGSFSQIAMTSHHFLHQHFWPQILNFNCLSPVAFNCYCILHISKWLMGAKIISVVLLYRSMSFH